MKLGARKSDGSGGLGMSVYEYDQNTWYKLKELIKILF